MTIQDIQVQIQRIIDKYPRTYTTVLQHSQRQLLNLMYEKLPDVFKDDRFLDRVKVYYFMNNITEPVRCSVCNNIIYKLNAKACSVKCAQQLPSVRNKIRKTNIAKTGTANGHGIITKAKMRNNYVNKWGVAHHTKNAEFRNKLKQHNVDVYGVEYTFQRDDVKAKIKSTCVEKLGVENPFASDVVKHQIAATLLDRYGVEHPMQAKSCRDKAKFTCLNKYGTDNVGRVDNIKVKMKQTCLAKYGVEYTGQTDIKKRNTADTNLKRYGSTTYAASDIAAKHAHTAFYDRIVAENSQVLAKFTESELDLKKLSTKILPWHCNICNTDFNAPVNYNWWRYHGHSAYARCPTCYPNISNSVSVGETELFDYVKSICPDAVQSNRTLIAPQELDIYIPSKNLAIEFDGLYWHSDDIKSDKNYHLNKTKLCEAKDIHLIHVFENEWLHKRDIVKSRIALAINAIAVTIGARKCDIVELSSKDARKFLNDNHLQGATNAKIRLGLLYNDELVSVMTFSKSRFSKKYEWELIRFCSKLNYQIQGAASKLLRYFERKYNPVSIVSYADRRWSRSAGAVYSQLGFTYSHTSGPDYWYWRNDEFYHRITCQKHKLANMLEKFDSSITEAENMYANGFKRIFDCGNLVFAKFKSDTVIK